MNFGQSAYASADRVIIRRRIEENKLAELQTAVQKNFHLGSVAKWEQSSSKLMSSKQKERERKEFLKQKEINLKLRKQKLRKLLAEEEIEFKIEIDSKIETPQERRERLEAKAKKLREERISRREKFVEMQRLKQFREQCDELRLNHGQNLTMECDRIRKQQIKEKELEKEYEKTLDSQYLNIWKQELQKKIDRESRESEYKKRLNSDTANAIKQQMNELNQERERLKQLKQKEINERVEKLNKLKEMEKLNEIERAKELQSKRDEMKNEYQQFQKRKIEEQQYEKKLDKDFIDRVLSEEKAKDKADANKQEENKNDIQNYLKYLQDLKEKEKENEKYLEKLRQNELEKEWSKREMKWKKEELARKQLLQNVIDERKNQIAYNQSVKERMSKSDVFEQQKLIQELDRYHKNEKVKEENRLKYNKEIQEFLRKQMLDRKQAEIDGHNDFLAFDVDADKNNKIYQKLLKQETEKDEKSLQDGKTTHHYPKTTANWWTF
mmetsp:Transcript_21532/g.18977  ORF Transcript_21532/g.18977 Transcript_21532/m.18977 type:complete len:496 (+) Transcript_21532:59-1546(+)